MITRETLEDMAQTCGLDDAAAAPAYPVPVDPSVLAALVRRMPPDLAYLQRGLERRLDPGLVLPMVRTVVVTALSYATRAAGAEALPEGHVFVSRHAWCVDYHRTVGSRVKRLAEMIAREAGARTRWYVDTGPVLEKAYGAASGLGFIGRNTLLIHPRLGSFIFLGVILSDATIEQRPRLTQGCGNCTLCQAACPAGALKKPYELDAARCAAFLNAACKTEVPESMAHALARNLYGCDLCQDVCPWNKRAACPDRDEFQPLPGLYMPGATEVLALGEDGVRRLFEKSAGRRRDPALVLGVARLLMQQAQVVL